MLGGIGVCACAWGAKEGGIGGWWGYENERVSDGEAKRSKERERGKKERGRGSRSAAHAPRR